MFYEVYMNLECPVKRRGICDVSQDACAVLDVLQSLEQLFVTVVDS